MCERLRREPPFEPEVALAPRLRGRRDHRHKQRARGDLPAEFRIPGIAAHEFALIIPDFDPGISQRLGHALHGGRIFPRVAEKDGERGSHEGNVRHEAGWI